MGSFQRKGPATSTKIAPRCNKHGLASTPISRQSRLRIRNSHHAKGTTLSLPGTLLGMQAEWWRLEPSRSPKHPSRFIGMKPLGLQDVHHTKLRAYSWCKSFPFRTSSSINWMDYNIIKVTCPNVHLFSINLQHVRYLYIYTNSRPFQGHTKGPEFHTNFMSHLQTLCHEVHLRGLCSKFVDVCR